MTPRGSAPIVPLAATGFGFAALLGLAGCAGLAGAVGDIALDVARRSFLGVTTENYGDQYTSDFGKLLDAVFTGIGVDDAAGAAAPLPTDAPPVTMDPAPAPYIPPPAIELVAQILKEVEVDGRSTPTPVEDGEVLYDPFSGDRGDNIKIAFRTNQSCYVYVIGIDGTGWATSLFPSSYTAAQNPVMSGFEVQVPEGRKWVTLDSYRGVEHVYFIASRFQRFDIEDAMKRIAANVREVDEVRAGNEPLAMVESEAVARGFGDVRLSELETESTDGDVFKVEASAFLAVNSTDDVVVTRWFRHQ